MPKPRPTYRQNWPAYNLAQTKEKAMFQSLLRDLCAGIVEPPQTRGRPRVPLCDAIFAAVFKVYSTVSGRRFMSDLTDARDKGHITRLPCYNSIFNIFEATATTPILRELIVQTSLPLRSIESSFACDSSGFSACRFDRWFDLKYGAEKRRRAWCKAHIMCGIKTNIITAVEIEGQNANDCPLMPALFRETNKRFNVEEVSADLGYSSEENLTTVLEGGAWPLIPFKYTASAERGGIWARMFHYFQWHKEKFYKRYHLRSNVESTFSMMKAKFGDSVRSKTDVAMKNEVLGKIICHNICCLISAIHELGIEPEFWSSPQVG